MCKWGLIDITTLWIFLGEVTFLQEPYSAVICPGSTFVFSCSYTGSSSLPEWIINKLRYNFNQVPHPHILRRIPNGYLLELQNVNILMNATSYQCSVQGILSNLVFLYIGKNCCSWSGMIYSWLILPVDCIHY